MTDLTEALKKKEKARQTRTERELQSLEAPPAKATSTPAPAKVKHVEQVGVGRDLVDETTKVVLKGIDSRIQMLAQSGGNPSLLAELQARRKLILEQAAEAKK